MSVESLEYSFSIKEIAEFKNPRPYFSAKWDKRGVTVLDYVVDDIARYADINGFLPDDLTNMTVTIYSSVSQTKTAFNVSIKTLKQFILSVIKTEPITETPPDNKKNIDALI